MSSKLGCEQIKQVICDKLVTGNYVVGDRLPSIREFSKSLDVKPERVRRAVLRLAKENLVELRHGSGTYIKELPGRQSISKQQDIVAWIADMAPNWYNVPLLDVLLHNQSENFHITVVSKNSKRIIASRMAKADGVIAISPSRQQLENIRKQVSANVPIVSVSRSYPDLPVYAVMEEGFHTAYDLTIWLIEQGHRRIAFIGRSDQQNQTYFSERFHGWQAALEDRGLQCGDDLVHWVNVSQGPGHSYFRAMMPVFDKINFDAMFCGMADLLAEAVRYDSIKDVGLVKRHAIAGIDHVEGVTGVAFACHDFNSMVEVALNRVLKHVTSSEFCRIERVAMKLSFPGNNISVAEDCESKTKAEETDCT